MKILGLDLGTNSVGWAVVEKNKNEDFVLNHKGVRIFQEGVKIEKGIESSKAAERTGFRSARRIKYRRKLRKVQLLKSLTKYGYCPELSKKELDDWRYKKVYPSNRAFLDWQRTDEEENKNPYYFRALAVEQKLDLTKKEDRYKIGRAFYHMVQRRGFLSNRLEGTKESEGAVKKSINEITKAKGDKTLGQYFYDKYLKGEKIRDTYTHREEHYLEEFNAIADFQKLPKEFEDEVHRAIFFQRPLKSQKGLIGKCVFETNKPRCPVSRPEFEEYRMLCFVNNIKIKTPEDERLRPLNSGERQRAIARFYLKRLHFDFEDIAKQLAPKKQYRFYKDRHKNPEDWLFNFSMKTTVSGCPVSTRFRELFGEGFREVRFDYRREKDGRTSTIDINDIWHVLFTFNSEKKLIEFAQTRLQFSDEQIKELLLIRLKTEYASLSLKAIRKILPYLRDGLIYSHAVFLANMENVIPDDIWNKIDNRRIITEEIHSIIKTQNEERQLIEIVNSLINKSKKERYSWSEEAAEIYRKDITERIVEYFGKSVYASFSEEKKNRIDRKTFSMLKKQMQANLGVGSYTKAQRIDERVKTFIADNFDIEEDRLAKLYHPSAIEVYKPSVKGKDGRLYLGSPMVSSIRNPMAMRALHQLRKVVNELIKEGVIDATTKVNIEMARGLLNANERVALQSWQRDRENKRKEYAKIIQEHFTENTNQTEPSEDDILKYQLWEEQKHKCIYTGDEISVSDFLGANPKYDIEHTIPRSLSFDNSQENKTLCQSKFNRAIKRNKIPFELQNVANYDLILERIEPWKQKYEAIEKQIQQAVRQSAAAVDKETKDRAIQKRHKLTFERNYWRNKYQRFTMKDVPEGFKNSQLVDTGIITKYARLYLKTVFAKVYTVKGNTVSDFRKMWGIQNEYEKKARVNHIHHCIDAVTIACITKENYDNLAKFYHDWEESYLARNGQKPAVDKPWETFTEDVKSIENEVLVSHYTPDVLPKQTKKKLRKRGRIQYNKDGKVIYQQGDTVRGSLHKETFYGAVECSILNKKGEAEKQIRYVIRKPLDSLEDSSVKHIVDEQVRKIVEEGRQVEKRLKKEIEGLKKKLSRADEHEEIAIKKEMNVLAERISNVYSLPNKNGKAVPIKKVRIYAPTVTNPIHLKKQRDKSLKQPKPYKEHIHVANDGNYVMAIYEGKDDKGKIKRDFEIVNNLTAGEYFKLSVQEMLKAQDIRKLEGLVPMKKMFKKIELPVKGFIKTGTLVMLWENTDDEVWELDISERKKRLYKVIGLSIQRIKRSSGKIDEYATIVLKHNSEARPGTDLKTQDGLFTSSEQYIPQRKLNHNQFNALIEGVDFVLSPTGKLTRK